MSARNDNIKQWWPKTNWKPVEITTWDKNSPLTISKWWVSMKTNKDWLITEISLWQSSDWGVSTKIWIAKPITKWLAMAIVAEIWADKLKWAVSVWTTVWEDGKLLAVINYISDTWIYSIPDFDGRSDEVVREQMSQVWLKVKYEQEIKSELIKMLKAYDVWASIKKSGDKRIETTIVDYDSEFYKVLKRWIEWATKYELK